MSNRHPSPPLLEDEWIVLLDVYLSHRNENLAAKHPALLRASETLNHLGQQLGRKANPNYRLPDGLRRQIGAFRHLDPTQRTGDRKVAVAAASVWKRFSSDPEGCRRAADSVRLKVGREGKGG